MAGLTGGPYQSMPKFKPRPGNSHIHVRSRLEFEYPSKRERIHVITTQRRYDRVIRSVDEYGLLYPTPALLKLSQGFETPRRAQTYGRRPEELHIPPNANIGQQGGKDMRHHSYHSSNEYAGGQAPGINVQQATPQGSQYSNSSAGQSLPGVLQPGRPGPSSSTTAPSTIPTLPQLQNPAQQQQSSPRPSTANHAHSYSRSSPAGLDQPKYAPFANTPESVKYVSTPTHRYTSSQTGQGDATYSPLGLADIRPLGESGQDGSQSANPYCSEAFPAFPTNSNYLAPWAVYAFDWCKWPVQQHSSSDSAGKMAIGSHVEDGHNFVSAHIYQI